MEYRPTSRSVARTWLLAVVIVVGIVPLALDRDSFPLSTYPMFSSNRSTREPVDTAVVVDPDGHEKRLDPWSIAGTDEPIIATVVVADSISDGTSFDLCSEIVDRVDPTPGSRVEIVTVVYDAVRWFEGDREPVSRVVHASCGIDTR